MVKGVNRRVVVVRSPNPKVFDEAIFIVRDDFWREGGADSARLLKEAGRAAESYLCGMEASRPRRFGRRRWPLLAAASAGAAALVWLVVRFVGVAV